jgi:hypothetical protein
MSPHRSFHHSRVISSSQNKVNQTDFYFLSILSFFISVILSFLVFWFLPLAQQTSEPNSFVFRISDFLFRVLNPIFIHIPGLLRHLKVFFTPVFTVLNFLEDFVTFLFNQINGLYLYILDGGFWNTNNRITNSWAETCNETCQCRQRDTERIEKVQERIEKLENDTKKQ